VVERLLYIFTLYALDTTLDLGAPGTVNMPMLLEAMQRHILTQAELRGYTLGFVIFFVSPSWEWVMVGL
jgi:hypothetical protein